jgi:membrane fusion protein, multidrug efflux system
MARVNRTYSIARDASWAPCEIFSPMPRSATKTTRPLAPVRPSIWRRHRRLWIAAGAVVAAGVLYFGAGAIVAYTSDAYVRSDLVPLAPEVAGIVKAVSVQDNQRVAAGDPVATIDPAPYQLQVELKQQQIARFEAAAAVKTQSQAADAAALDAANAALRLAQEEFERAKALTGERVFSQSQYDKAADGLRAARDRVSETQNQIAVDEREIAEANAAVAVARAELAVAQYALSRTRLAAPVSGYVNNLTLQPGAYARAGEAIVGIVDESSWRIVANFKEDVAAALIPGKRVWVWLDSDPWHVLPGHVQGVGRGIAREQAPDGLLPYVAPTTDWIRLRRRLPVTILLDPPAPAQGLFMGADARVFLFR